MRRSLPLLFAAAALAPGCSDSTGRYPSLLPRAIEGRSLAEPERPEPTATPDAALDTRLAAAMQAIDSAHAAFLEAARTAEARIAVARGTQPGTDRWLAAQSALGAVDSARAPLTNQLAELEQMAIARAEAGEPPYPALDAVIDSAARHAAAQAERVAALEAAFEG